MTADTGKRYKSSKRDVESKKQQSERGDSHININKFSKTYTDWYQKIMGSKQPHQKFVEHYESASNTLNQQLDRISEFKDICANIYHPLHKHLSKTYTSMARQYTNKGVPIDHNSITNMIRQIDDLMKHLLSSFSDLSTVVMNFATKYRQESAGNKK